MLIGILFKRVYQGLTLLSSTSVSFLPTSVSSPRGYTVLWLVASRCSLCRLPLPRKTRLSTSFPPSAVVPFTRRGRRAGTERRSVRPRGAPSRAVSPFNLARKFPAIYRNAREGPSSGSASSPPECLRSLEKRSSRDWIYSTLRCVFHFSFLSSSNERILLHV